MTRTRPGLTLEWGSTLGAFVMIGDQDIAENKHKQRVFVRISPRQANFNYSCNNQMLIWAALWLNYSNHGVGRWDEITFGLIEARNGNKSKWNCPMRCKCYCRNYQTQLPPRDVFISVCLTTNPIPVRSQIKVFSLTQRGESSAPFKVDRSESGQTMLGDNLRHNDCHAS